MCLALKKLKGFEAGGADFNALFGAADHDGFGLQVGHADFLGFMFAVGDIQPDLFALAADITDSRHRMLLNNQFDTI